MNLIRSLLHGVWMAVTVVPWALFVIAVSYLVSSTTLYWLCVGWLRTAVRGGTWILGIRNRVQGLENLPQGATDPAVLLVKHQSTWETFVMPTIMPHPLAYVFKKELLHIPFFGWAIGRLDMIHIDRSQRAKAFAKVVEQGRALLAQGVWVIMFPEGTRIPRGQVGEYKTGGARLAIAAGVPVIPIAVTSGQRAPQFPNLEAVAETYPGFEAIAFLSFIGYCYMLAQIRAQQTSRRYARPYYRAA